MKFKKRLSLAFACLILGIVFFLIHRKILIVQINMGLTHASDFAHTTANHKSVRLYFKKDGAWRYETTTLVWQAHNDAHNIKLLITQWLATLTDEQLIPPNITLESVALSSPGSDLYLSFDRSLFEKNSSTISKWAIIEGLIKTIYAVNSSLQGITLQVRHQPMIDDHLELSSAIPIQDFCA